MGRKRSFMAMLVGRLNRPARRALALNLDHVAERLETNRRDRAIEATFEFDSRRSSREAYLVRRVARRATHSIVADVDPADPDAVVRATPLPTPFAAQTAFPVPIVAMPPARAALARAMATVDLNQIIPRTTGLLVEVHRSGVGS